MKSNSYFTFSTGRKLLWLLLGLLCHAAVLRVQAQPTLTGLPTSVSITDAQTTNLFSAASVTATNQVTVHISFLPANLGSLSSGRPNFSGSGGNYTIGPSSAGQVNTTLQGILFTPTDNYIPVPNTSNVVFQVYAVDSASSSTNTVTVSVTSVNDAPQVNGSGVTSITDAQTASPFTSVTVVDPDNSGQQLQTVTISMSDTNGYLVVGSSGFTSNNLVYTLANVTPAAASTALGQLVYHPFNNLSPVNQYYTNTFTITDSDGIASDINTGVSVVMFSQNDAPVITASGAAHITDQQQTAPLGNVLVTDPDQLGQQQQTVVVSLLHTNTGSLVVTNSGFISTGSNSCYYVGAAASISNAIAKLIYRPINNLLPVGQYDTNTMVIVDSDGIVSVTNAAVSVVVYSTNDAPTLTGVLANHIPVFTGQQPSPSPFATAALADVDHSDDPTNANGQTLVWTVSLRGSTTPLGNLQYGGGQGSSFVFTNDQLTAGSILRTFNYLPPSQNIAGTNFITIAITADDLHGGTVSNNIYVDVSTLVLPVILSGTQSGQPVFDNSTLQPFGNVFIQSRNGFPVNLSIKLTNAVNDVQGSLINAASLNFSTTTTANSLVYQLHDTSENVTAAIRALVFQPVPNRINGSGTDTATFEIDLNDGLSTNSPDTSSTVVIIPVNDSPQIAGVTPLTTIPDNQTAIPFGTVRISDVDEKGQQTNKCVITFNTATGYLTNTAGSTPFVFSGGGYMMTDTPTNLTRAINQLVFVPVPGLVPVGLTTNTTFNVVLDDFHGGVAANNNTVVRVASTAGVPVVTLPSPLPYSIFKATNVLPFANLVSISGASQPFALSLVVSNTVQGDFTAASVTSAGFASLGGGAYFVGGTASNLTAAIQQLVFAPNTNLTSGTVINFTISVTNSLTPPGITTVIYPIALRTTRSSHIVTQFTDDGTTTKPGTLRNAIANAQTGDHITFDLGSSGNAEVITLKAPLFLNTDLVFDGPGAERLAISGDSAGTGTPTVQLFVVNANVTMNRMTFMEGYSPTNGGAFEVNANGSLKLSYCAVTDCRADQYGGGVDANDGVLDIEHCLFLRNSTSAQLGVGGGAVSMFTAQTCTFLDTTFATNRQNTVGDGTYTGLGGGAMYAEPDYGDVRFPPFLNVYVLNCTFHDNVDVSGHGTSIRPNGDNSDVFLQNSILADGQGNNLELDLSGNVMSLGGNLSDDSTRQTYSSGGAPVYYYIFSPPLDRTNIPATNVLAALANNSGPTLTYALLPTGPAVGNAVSNVPSAPYNASTVGADQRGYFRTNAPDIGAFELSASQRIIIEELGCNPVNPNNQFIEFYVPRDSAPLNVGGLQVWVDGTRRHTFTNQLVQPGQALVLQLPGSSISVPAGVLSQVSTNGLALTQDGSVITLLNASSQTVFQADYVGAFVSTDPTDAGHLATPNQSLVLWPQFYGSFLPYERVVALAGGTDTNGLSDPGFDASGKSLGGGNAPPTANPDFVITDAHTALPGIQVLTNDVEPDITDTIQVVGLGTNSAPGVTDLVSYSTLGALVTIVSNGASISYDPTVSPILQSLPQGVITNDSFLYTILDYSNNIAHSRGSTQIEISNNLVKATATVSVVVVGVNSQPTPQNDNAINNTNLATFENAVLDFTTATNILWNDTDPNSDDNSGTLNIVSINSTNGYVPNLLAITTALGATATLDLRFSRNQSHITYDPRGSAVLRTLDPNQHAIDTFYYSVVDSHGAIGTASISIWVNGVDSGVAASPFAFATDEDTAVAVPLINVLTNCSAVDAGDILGVSGVTGTSADGALVQIVGTNLVYNPTVSLALNGLAQKETTVDTFSFTVTNQFGSSATAVASVLVTGINDRPVAKSEIYATDQNTPLTVSAGAGVLAEDYDPDFHDKIRVFPFAMNTFTNCDTGPNGGAPVTVNTDGSFTFDPRTYFDTLRPGETNNDVFSYVIMDHSLSIAGNDSFAVLAGSSNNVMPVLANDVVLSAAGGAFSIVGVSMPSQGGTVSINASSNAIIYTPVSGYSGTETFFYTNSDGLGGSDWAQVSITVKGSTLYALSDAYSVAQGTTNVLNVMANDLILPTSTASISITSVGSPDMGGTALLNGAGPNNAITYWPNPTNSGSYVEHFSYTITSGTNTATAVVTVSVMNLANTLVVNNDYFTILAGSANNPLDVLANDAVISSLDTNLVITGFTVFNLQGTVSINDAGNRLVYTPNPASTQSGSITYYVADGDGNTGQGSAVIQIASTGLFAGNDYFTVIKNSVSNALPVMVNDVELPNNGQHLFITDIGIGANAPQHGSVTINPSGTGLIYTPNANFNGSDSFTYEISDGSPARAQATVSVNILDNSASPSNPDVFRVARESANNVLNVLANDPALPVAPSTRQITGLLTNGVHAIVLISGTNASNVLLYTPSAGFIGQDNFSYVFVDNLGNMGTNTVSVSVGDLEPRDDAFTVLSGSVTNFLDVRANDYPFPDTNALRAVASLGVPDHGGTVASYAGGTGVLYTPANGYVGVEHFTYTLADDTGIPYTANVAVTVRAAGSDRATNTVTIAVAGVNDAPTITGVANGQQITDKQTINPFATVVVGDRDQCGYQTNTVIIVMDNVDKGSLQNLGGFTVVSNGVYQMTGVPANLTTALQGIVFVPVPNHIIVPTTATIHFNLSANDGFVPVPTAAQVAVNVTAVNDPPVISGTVSGQLVYDRLSLNPFAGVLITELDNDRQQALRCTVTLDNANKGMLTSLGGFVYLGGGIYTYGSSNGAVTAAMITSALRGLVYTPTTAGRVTPGSPETTRFTLSVDDFFAPTVVDSNTTVVAIDPLTGSVSANDALSGAQFGYSVATLRDLAVIGAPLDTSSNAGSVYLYSRSLDGSNTWTQFKKLRAPDARGSDHFGTAVAVSGDMLVVGAPLNAASVASSGAAYVFGRNQGGSNQWGFVKKLSASDAIINDQFGTAVAISNTLVAVGSPLNDVGASQDAGSVYLFDQNQGGSNAWGQVKKLTLTNAAASDHFGSAVAISGDNLLIGAPLVKALGITDAGAAYIFGRNQGGANQWGLSARLNATNPVASDHFGTAVAISGSNLVVGAPLVDISTNLVTTNNDAGAAYVYSFNPNGTNEWDLIKKLTLANAFTADHFGASVAIDSGAVVVGTPLQDANNFDAGSVYLFMQNQGGSNTWGLVDRFLPASNVTSNYLGCAVAIYQNTVVAGAYNGLAGAQRSGTAYMFRIFYDNPPQLLVPVPNQSLQVGVPFAFSVPAGAFADPDIADILTYSLAASPAVPNWLNFNPASGAFSGTPTATGTYPINLVATDIYGTMVTNQFSITVTSGAPANFNLLSANMVSGQAMNVLAIQFTGVPSSSYRLQCTTNLANPVWSDVATQVSDINGGIYLNLTNPPTPSFYRTVSP